MKGYESRIWICWPDRVIGYEQPKSCRDTDPHSDCGKHDVLVPVSYSESTWKKSRAVQGEAIRR